MPSVAISIKNAARDAIESQGRGATDEAQWLRPHDGAGWCSWRAFYNYFWQEFRLGRKLIPHYALDQSGAFWWWWFKDSAHLCAPPAMQFDQGTPDGSEAFRLHCDDGPAVKWPDGYSLWFWRDVNVPQGWIEEPETICAKTIVDEQNQERKRALCEILGWERALQLLDVKQVQRDDYGALLVTDVIRDDHHKPATFCDVKCPSSGRRYIIRVPPETRTCRAGLAWSAGVKEGEYEFAMET
jgi:hypothetical protein